MIAWWVVAYVFHNKVICMKILLHCMDMEITLINNNVVLASNISFELGNVDVPNICYMYGCAFSVTSVSAANR